ncbi:MAG: signal transduction histidine kinase/CheY-like chemotaxis protein/AraC-like DNA-binding protein, partial [Patescibacteria group bacterium]
GKVYWMKTRLHGSTIFNGEQLLHVSSEIGNDLYSYDQLDIYISDGQDRFKYQQTGDQVGLEDRPLNFWATFIKVNVLAGDTIDVFIRMEGMDRYFPLEEFALWHIDPSSVFPRQLHEARAKIIFFGMLGIQFLFFLCLYFIEREKIHLQFTSLICGTFLAFAFAHNNYHTYVPFPVWKDYHFLVFMLGTFLITTSLLKFAATYFNYPATSTLSRKIIPYLIVFFAVLDILTFIFVRQYSFKGSLSFFKLAMICHFVAFVPFFAIAFSAKDENKSLRKLFFIAFTPVTVLFLLLQIWGFIYPFLEGFSSKDYIYYLLHLRNSSMLMVVFMLGILALSIGYRTKLLKEEKERILKQNLIAENTILENRLKTEKLEELDELKTRFFTNITHEFRTPLTVIMGINAELAEKSKQLSISSSEKNKLEEGRGLIERNSKNLLHLINQILDLSKVDNRMLTLFLKQANIISFLNYLTESFYSKSQEKKVRLVFYTELKILLMDFDETKIQQLVYNLLSNALKFTDRGGKIIFHAEEENIEGKRQLIMKVADSGQGIAPEALPHIFNRFYQAEANKDQNNEGTGIGLALTKELAELMGGEIKAESEIGKGTVVTVVLPIKQEAPFSEHSWNVENETNIILTASDEIEDDSVADGKEAQLPLLLLVEDNKDIRYYLAQLVEGLYQIVMAENGAIGMEKAFQLIPDIIISDVIMPVKNGFELTETLKEDHRTSHIPIILLTAKATEADKVQGLKKGADAYLMKPFNKEELMIRLERLLALRKALQDRLAPSSMVTEEVAEKALGQELTIEERFLQKLRTTVINHLADPNFTIDELAAAVGLGKSQLSRKLKALTNETPTTFIRNIRLTKGMQLLKSSDLNVAEIAYKAGFRDPNYFSRAFHKLFGKSPTAYRK